MALRKGDRLEQFEHGQQEKSCQFLRYASHGLDFSQQLFLTPSRPYFDTFLGHYFNTVFLLNSKVYTFLGPLRKGVSDCFQEGSVEELEHS